MRYRLGLDLGVSSVGSAVLQLSDENEVVKIADAGSRIFEVSEGAEDRRLKRTARKNTIRTKKRLELLATLLFENGLWSSPDPKGTRKLRALSPYELRSKALDEKLSEPEMVGRIILHLAKHRGAGFVSAAVEMEEEILEAGDKKKTNSPYEIMGQHLKETNSRTLGEFFYKRICESYEKQDPHLRMIRQRVYALSSKAVDYAIPRYLVKDEFNLIWDVQARFYPVMNKDGLKEKVYSVLFFERPAFPYAIGQCIYFNNEDRLLKAHPLSERRRIYESVNNIRIFSAKDKRRLTLAERDLIVAELMKGRNAGKKVIKDLLHLPADQKVSIDEGKGAPIKAYLYSTDTFAAIPYFTSISEEKLCDFIEFLADPRNPNDKNGRLYNEEDLISILKIKLGIDDEKQIGELLTKLPKGRAMLGLTATKTIVAELKGAVLSQREITDNLAKTDKHYMAEEEIARQNQGKYTQLPYYGKILTTDTAPVPESQIKNNPTLNEDEKKYGKIANPAVHMILNQVRAVVNDIIRIYGKPYEISLEVGRDVGLSAKKKKEWENRNKINEKLNDEARAYLQSRKLYVNAKNILKYKLAKQQSWKDAYNPLKSISQSLSGCEIEHIIPQAKHGTDTFNNLVLVSATDNRQKSDEYAYEFFQRTKTEAEISAVLKFARENLKEKSWRFEPDARERFEESGDEDATNRYLTDTRYVSKMAQRYLRTVIDCPQSQDASVVRILAPRGGYTATLRRIWNLEGLEYDISGIDIPQYLPCEPHYIHQETGEIVEGREKPDSDSSWHFYDKKKNSQWRPKPRLDHRHHAMDAIVVACLNRSFMQKMARIEKLGGYIPKNEYPLPLAGMDPENRKVELSRFRQEVVSVLNRVLVSHKPDRSKAGQLHKDTGRTVLGINPTDKKSTIIVYKRKIQNVVKKKADLKKLLVSPAVKDEWIPLALEKGKEENMTEREWAKKQKLWNCLAEDRVKQAELVSLFEDYYPSCLQALEEKRDIEVADGKKRYEISENMVLTEVLKTLQKEKLWQGDTFKCYEASSALIDIPKHGLAYESGNNNCIDFYEKDGKVGWELMTNFDANQHDYVPDWKCKGAKPIWRLFKSDMIELDTPDEWKHYTDKPRCLARVKKFCDGAISIDYLSDARMTSPVDKTLKYMFVETLENRGLSYLINHHARKIELTPFGKIKRRHKILKNGQKKKE